jgi:hypothetical protein
MNVDQWRFYIMPTAELNHDHASRRSIKLASIEKRCSPIHYADLRRAVEEEGKKLRFLL